MNFTKTILWATLAFSGFAANAGNSYPPLLGAWTTTAYVVGGQRVSVPDPKQHVVSVFTETGLNHFFSWRDDEAGFCGWRALWSYDEASGVLTQQVVAIDPKSRPDCANDTDLQVGRELRRPMKLANDELQLASQGADPVLTIWTRLEKTYPTPKPIRAF